MLPTKGKGEFNMIKQIWIWSMILLLLLVSLPGLFDRWSAEVTNNTYEMAVPYEEVYNLTTGDDADFSINEALASLKDAGLNTVSINPFSLYSLAKQDIITIYDEVDLVDALRFSDQAGQFNANNKGYYITVPASSFYKELILDKLNLREVMIGNEPFYFIPEASEIGLSTSLGYNEEAMNQINQQDLHYMLRVENSAVETDNRETINQLIDLKDGSNGNLLFSGQDVIGYPTVKNINKWSNQLRNAGYSFYSIEFTEQRGLQSLARNTDYHTIRLHSMDLDNKTLNGSIDQAIRAVKERNIRSIFFHLRAEEPAESLENATAFIEGVHHDMPASFDAGIPAPFDQIATPAWIKMVVLLAGILFTYLAAGVVNHHKLRIAACVFMVLLALFYLLLQKLLLLQVFALIIAVITPIYALLSTSNRGTAKIGKLTLQYAKAIGISVVGIIIVIGLLNGNAFITGFELFRGVKLVYAIPILFLVVFLFWRLGLTLLNVQVRYWHLVVLLLLGAMGLYYISRTGNAGSVSDVELMIRNGLEEALYVRPRTKEFLIGFPFYILALYVMSLNRLWGKVLLIPGIIGFLSMMNTFTHLHIPLHISILRTAYSVVIGYVIGILLIYLFKLCAPFLSKAFKKRWT